MAILGGGTVLPATEGVIRGDGVVKSSEGGAATAGFGHREALGHPGEWFQWNVGGRANEARMAGVKE